MERQKYRESKETVKGEFIPLHTKMKLDKPYKFLEKLREQPNSLNKGNRLQGKMGIKVDGMEEFSKAIRRRMEANGGGQAVKENEKSTKKKTSSPLRNLEALSLLRNSTKSSDKGQ